VPRARQTSRRAGGNVAILFESAEEAWFWGILSRRREETARPCEPMELLRIVDRLYRQRRLIRDHLLVLSFYGRRRAAPDPRCRREQRAAALWREAMLAIGPALRRRGIVR
jgi:hypothetical protein